MNQGDQRTAQRICVFENQSGVAANVMHYAANWMQPSHVHNYVSITLILRGTVAETFADRTEYAMPLSIVIKPVGMPHADRYGPHGCLALQIRLTNQAFLNEFGRMKSMVWHHTGGPALKAFLSLVEYASTPSGSQSINPETVASEILSAVREWRDSPGNAPNWLKRMKDFLDNISPESCANLGSLAGRAGVHPVHLTRQFKRHFGCSIREYVQSRRVRAAAKLVERSSLALTDISYELGYTDQPHLCRCFKNFAGLTPGQYRVLCQKMDFNEMLKRYK